jgi:dihydrolipoamide dehydrogenase
MCIPDSEHIGHLMARAIQRRLTVQDLLYLPYKHPTLEAELHSALCNIKRQPANFEDCIERPCRGHHPAGTGACARSARDR